MNEFPAGAWAPVPAAQRQTDRIAGKSVSYGRDVLYQFTRRWTSVLGLVLVLLIILAAIFGPSFSSHTYSEQNLTYVNAPPRLTVYVVNGNYYYVTSSTKLLAVTAEGALGDAVPRVKDDGVKKHFVYEIGGQTYFLNYRNNPATLETEAGTPVESTRIRNALYPLGADALGRDILVRLLYGARISLTVAFVATLVNLIIGILYGSVSGYAGGMADLVMMRIVDIISAIPLTMYVILIMVLFNNGGLASIIIALGSVYWVDMARVVRGEILSLKKQEYVTAALTMGSSTSYILRRHLIPNAVGPIIVTATMQIPSAIFTEAFMSFIGLGVSAPMASWGTMCNDALETLQTAPYQLLFPAAAICVTMFAFNFIGDGLRDAFDPQLRR